ncbi:MAG: cytochrome C, partial [Anaerolineae bacterium]|nr:cytochrome C [Anaerolineae bacterium]
MELASRNRTKAYVSIVFVLLLGLVLFAACRDEEGATDNGESAAVGVSQDADAIAEARGLTPDDVAAALKTYMPTGRHDDYMLFASGGHAGQVYAIGLPSMRILKQIAVFTPEPWQGYGYGAKETMEVLEGGYVGEMPLTWGDTHHPALSETGGDYDGQFLFINDKANARVAVIDLRDFE